MLGRTNAQAGASLKYASGTATLSGNQGQQTTMSITGLGFRPRVIAIACTSLNSAFGFGIVDDDGNVTSRTINYNYTWITVDTFVPNDDGFTITVYWQYGTTEWNWYAIG